MICAGWNFDTEDGNAHFTSRRCRPCPRTTRRLRLSTRRGKQFNSMVQEQQDALTGAVREAVLISADDAVRLGVANGDKVVAAQRPRRARAARSLISPVKPGNVQVHWPEGNVLIETGVRSPEAQIPDYNTWVEIEA